MKLNKSQIKGIFVITLLAAVSCSKSGMEAHLPNDSSMDSGGHSVRVTFLVDNSDVRSAIGSDSFLSTWEKKVNNVTIFQFVRYDDGRKISLSQSYYYSDPSKAEVMMVDGLGYEFLVLANVGDRRSEVLACGNTPDALKDYSVSVTDFVDGLKASGVPMSCIKTTDTGSDGSGIEFDLERLVSKVNFRFTNRAAAGRLILEHGSFVATSLTLRDASRVYFPWRRTMCSWACGDGDNASSFGNMQSINAGETVPFYCLPNNLYNPLPSGAKMSDRLPENFYENNDPSSKPTYVEVAGDYTDGTGELHAAITMRLYLGEAPESFNVFENSVLDLNVTLTDVHGYLESNWRLEPTVTDNRTIAFADKEVQLTKNEPKTVDILCNGKKASEDNATYKAFGLTFTLSDNLKAVGASFDAGTRTLALASNPDIDITGTLTATSWDGRQKATLTVVAIHGVNVGGDDGGGTGGGEIYY